jgi:hypothetical protein
MAENLMAAAWVAMAVVCPEVWAVMAEIWVAMAGVTEVAVTEVASKSPPP